MGSVAGEAAGDVAGPPLAQLGDNRLGVALGTGPRPISDLGELGAAGETEVRSRALEWAGELRGCLGSRGDQRNRSLGQRRVPGRERLRVAAALDPRQQAVALRERLRVGAGKVGSGRP